MNDVLINELIQIDFVVVSEGVILHYWFSTSYSNKNSM